MILVTGGAGFIGSHVVDALRAAGEQVRVLDCLHPAAHHSIPSYVDDELVRADVRDAAAVRAALSDVDVVVHQAAMVGLGVDTADLPEYVGCNDLGTAVLLAEMAAAGIRRLVLASSMVVYGEGGYACAEHGTVRPGPRREADLAAGRYEPPCPYCGAWLRPRNVPESAPLDPRNTYAATKLAQEHLAAAWARDTGGSVVALRYHNVYGPRMPRDTPYAGVAALFRSALERGEAPQVYEDGAQRRDFVHVRDVAAANLAAVTATGPRPSDAVAAAGPRPSDAVAAAGPRPPDAVAAAGDRPPAADLAAATATGAGSPDARQPGAAGPAAFAAGGSGFRAYNVASGQPHTVGEMATVLAEAFGGPAPVVTGRYRLGDVRHVVAAPDLARTELGFRAAIGFGDGVTEFASAPLRR
ncbi:NAD-dependent dehydratase [Actinocatenispora sera]|uniref:NAD-dependent dehydratase n=1 Tax=Actinocatenispora sera TaxID=390989 RepID=A0A810L9U1_9ACTN|nr:NAD-dependent epimerase/dehydratase family protein [Actinocatenispora sera]BCJ32330.1 NAD-dependent dehydratase [Actinocatenispora sera]